jgi:hypothetical protein
MVSGCGAIVVNRPGSRCCFLLPFSPTLFHCLADPSSRCCRQVPLPAIGLTGGCPVTPALSALKDGDGAVEPVPFSFQFRDDRLCVQGVSLLVFRMATILQEER